MDERYLSTAEQLEAERVDLARKRIQQLAQRTPRAGFDGTHCVDCDAPIPEGRLRLGYDNCVPCQTLMEKL